MKQDNVALRKRTQIAKANRTMFLWIAVASVLVGAALVVSFFLYQKLSYGEKVLAAKQATETTLNENLKVVNQLKTEVKALEANSALLSIKANDSDSALQVVLDALPSDANSNALGASLQERLLAGIEGNFTLETLQITPVSGLESIVQSENVVDATDTGAVNTEINFNFSVKGSPEALRQVLRNLERSIRTIVITDLSIEKQEDSMTLSVGGHAFYQPAKSIELKDKTVENK